MIDCLIEEISVLRGPLQERRLRLADEQRRRLASEGTILGRSVLAAVATIVTRDTILRWHRPVIA